MDWKGNKHSVFVTLGASNHTDKEREKDDYYATEPKATEELMKVEKFNNNIWECACGGGHMSEVIKKYGYNVKSTDLIDRGYGDVLDFLQFNGTFNGDIITNPPYKYALKFVEKALDVIPVGNKVAMFLRIQFLEGKARLKFFKENPPKYVYVASSRLMCAMNGDFVHYNQSATCFCWFVWEKGFTGETIVRWINED